MTANHTMYETFSPNLAAAGLYDRRVLGKVIGRVDRSDGAAAVVVTGRNIALPRLAEILARA